MDNKKIKIPKPIKIIVLCLIIVACLIIVYLKFLKVSSLNNITVSWLRSDIIEAKSYLEKNSSYFGFIPERNYGICGERNIPIINISSDGKDIAIFRMSCNKSKYYCLDSMSKLYPLEIKAVIPEPYVKSGATNCDYKKR